MDADEAQMNILHIVGARPNFMKLEPVYRGLKAFATVEQDIVLTGQHNDPAMSDDFFDELRIPDPLYRLAIENERPHKFIGEAISRIGTLMEGYKPDLAIVYGDVNSTLAGAIAANKVGVKLAHVEAGLRSYEHIPEETNRVLVDRLSDLLYTHSEEANAALKKEGITKHVYNVGNVMIDSLVKVLSTIKDQPQRKEYIYVTMHRPYNVDTPEWVDKFMSMLATLSHYNPVVFPVHPRTKPHIHPRWYTYEHLHLLEPISYKESITFQKFAKLIVTDSGGVQEESTYLGVPCLTVRVNTERYCTVSKGTNLVVGTNLSYVRACINDVLTGTIGFIKRVPPLWDGNAGQRIADSIMKEFPKL